MGKSFPAKVHVRAKLSAKVMAEEHIDDEHSAERCNAEDDEVTKVLNKDNDLASGHDRVSETMNVSKDTSLRWDFDVISLDTRDKVKTCVRILFRYLAEPTGYKIPEAGLRAFAEDVRTNMTKAWVDDVPLYHNFDHGVDVLLQVAHYMFVAGARQMLTPIDMLGLGLAALGHDVSHPGLNNAYHVNTQHELALRYSDTAVLEAHSAAVVATFLRDRQVLNILPDKEFKRVRSVICSSILGTDMSVHFKTVERLATFVEAEPWVHDAEAAVSFSGASPPAKKLLQPEDRKFLCDVLLHCADVSNPSRPWPICKRWSDLVVEEFFRQGDKEKLQGLPISPNCNRATSSQPTLSIGFSDFVVKPLFVQVANVLPCLEETALYNLVINRDRWVELKDAETTNFNNVQTAPAVSISENLLVLQNMPLTKTPTDLLTDSAPTIGDVEAFSTRITANDGRMSRRKRSALIDGHSAGLQASIHAHQEAKKKASGKRVIMGTKLASKWATGPDSASPMHNNSRGCLQAPRDPLVACRQRVVARLYGLHQRKSFQMLFFIITILALVGNGIRYAFLSPNADYFVNLILTIILGLFIAEITLLSFAEKGYRYSAFMAFDVIGAASLILDVPWLQGGRHGPILAQATAARGTTRVARAVRLIRFMRFIRLVRMARLLKVLDCFSNRLDMNDVSERNADSPTKIQNESKPIPPRSTAVRGDQADMGSKLSDRLSRRMLLVVLFVLLVVPYLTVTPNIYVPQVQLLKAMGSMSHAQRIAYVQTYERRFNVLYLRVAGYNYVGRKDGKLKDLRFHERVTYEVDYHGAMIRTHNEGNSSIPSKSKVIQNFRPTIREEAEYEILLITFISLLLVFSSWTFSEVADEVVVRPVDRMLRLVSRVVDSIEVLRRDAQHGELEADFLEHSIGKISEMLRFGFGTTRSMFGDTMFLGNSATVATLESVHVNAAFVFLDMHNYHDSAIEPPSDAIFSYVSVVSQVVREAVQCYMGGIARSTGNAFLIVWRQSEDTSASVTSLGKSGEACHESQGSRTGWHGLEVSDFPEQNACDLAFKTITRCAFDATHLNSVSEKAKDLTSQLLALGFKGDEDDDIARPRFVSYLISKIDEPLRRLNPITSRYQESAILRAESKRTSRSVERTAAKLEKYGCSLFFASGLHFGSAVETRPAGMGLARNEYADCSFMSTDVSLAAKLESAAAAIYGCTMLMSGQFVNKLAPASRQRTRQVDRARLKNVDHPVSLHTYDFLPARGSQYTYWRPIISLSELTTLYDFPTLESCEWYLKSFDRALNAYLDGDWPLAYRLFEKVSELQADDPPLQAIMRFMASNDNTRPPDWRGYRE